MGDRIAILLTLALKQLLRVNHVHTIGPTVVNILNELVFVVTIRIKHGFAI